MSASAGRTSRRFRKLAAILRRERRDCWLCRQPINYDAKPGEPDSFTVDHIKPLESHPHLAEVYSNLAAAHWNCNDSKGNRLPAPGLGEVSRQW